MESQQLRFAKKIKQEQLEQRQQSSSKKGRKSFHADLPISSEMKEWLKYTMCETDDEGYLSKKVISSVLQPLDSMSAYCPNAAVMADPFAATRLSSSLSSSSSYQQLNLSKQLDRNDTSSWKDKISNSNYTQTNSTGVISTNQLVDGYNTPADDPRSRLNVKWLQRKALLENEAGDGIAAVKTLEEAISLHLGMCICIQQYSYELEYCIDVLYELCELHY